ncbi:hypothetical protein FQR65_LT10536 [Abscondita terminalis]|nr:hypothetical protein FQR65_LT10536 [Abscondita terminalis]
MHTRPITTLSRPRCVCTGKITAIMHDINGGFCIYYGEDGNRRWKCENSDEWDRYLNTIRTIVEEPTFLVSAASISAKPLEGCNCWEGYKANGDGTECQGILVRPVMPCNEPEPPQCKCSTDATDILNEDTGLWCRTYVKGVEVKRWKCENQDEWGKFFAKHPDFKF